MAMQKGIARGIFSNEAGIGSAPIAAAAAQNDSPAKQGLISMMGTIIDTLIICTMTGLTIVITDSWNVGLDGVAMLNWMLPPELSSRGCLLTALLHPLS